ncbi:hypothetical protein CI102_7073 [Trichoderma harzianum]|nr:hypothetical protein CI102_7073 [Trichoderma harzianum]
MPLSAAQMVLFLVVCSIPVRNAGGRRNEMKFEAKLGQGRSLFLHRECMYVCIYSRMSIRKRLSMIFFLRVRSIKLCILSGHHLHASGEACAFNTTNPCIYMILQLPFATGWSGSNGIRSAYSVPHPIRVSVLVRREVKNHLAWLTR